MAKYRLRPPQFEAVKFVFGVTSVEDVTAMLGIKCEVVPESRSLKVGDGDPFKDVWVGDGDWIVQNGFGEVFRVKDADFKRTYEGIEPGELF
jgi:hypothetical protein